jgi:hypothetical protein
MRHLSRDIRPVGRDIRRARIPGWLAVEANVSSGSTLG